MSFCLYKTYLNEGGLVHPLNESKIYECIEDSITALLDHIKNFPKIYKDYTKRYNIYIYEVEEFRSKTSTKIEIVRRLCDFPDFLEIKEYQKCILLNSETDIELLYKKIYYKPNDPSSSNFKNEIINKLMALIERSVNESKRDSLLLINLSKYLDVYFDDIAKWELFSRIIKSYSYPNVPVYCSIFHNKNEDAYYLLFANLMYVELPCKLIN
jgi:hypothetical protein